MVSKNRNDATPGAFFALGIGAGASGAVAFLAFVLCAANDDKGVYNFLKDWQTFAAGILALVAAVPTVFMLNKQIRQEQERAEELIERDQYAAKAALPSGLVELSDYLLGCFEFLRGFRTWRAPSGSVVMPEGGETPRKPQYPSNAVRLIEVAVRSASTDNREALAWILRRLQIVDSRLGTLESIALAGQGTREIFVRHGWITFICDVLEMWVRSRVLFDYARGKSDLIDTRLSSDDMSTAAFFQDFHDEDIPELADAIRRRSENPSE
jgi:hypothetical protein